MTIKQALDELNDILAGSDQEEEFNIEESIKAIAATLQNNPPSGGGCVYVEAELTGGITNPTSMTVPITYTQLIDHIESGVNVVIYSEEENEDAKGLMFYTIKDIFLDIPLDLAHLDLTIPGATDCVELHAVGQNSFFSWEPEGPVY